MQEIAHVELAAYAGAEVRLVVLVHLRSWMLTPDRQPMILCHSVDAIVSIGRRTSMVYALDHDLGSPASSRRLGTLEIRLGSRACDYCSAYSTRYVLGRIFFVFLVADPCQGVVQQYPHAPGGLID